VNRNNSIRNDRSVWAISASRFRGQIWRSQTLVTGVVLGEPGCALAKEEGEIRLRRRLDGEKVFSPKKEGTRRGSKGLNEETVMLSKLRRQLPLNLDRAQIRTLPVPAQLPERTSGRVLRKLFAHGAEGTAPLCKDKEPTQRLSC
jgi:hypothetical protein